MQKQVPIVQKMQKTVEASQAKSTDRVMNAPVIMQRHVPTVQVAQKTIASPAENDHLTQQAEKYRDEDKVDKTKIKAKSGLENHCTAMRNTSMVKELRSMFEVGHRKEAPARNWSDKDAQEKANLTNQRQVPAIRSVQKTVEVPRVQYIDKVADIPVNVQRRGSIIQAAHHDLQHIDEDVHVPALMQSEVPTIPDTDDLCSNETADEDWLEQENKRRRLPTPAETVSECRADESDFDRFDDLVLPSPERKTLFMSIASGDEAEDEPEKQQEITRCLVQGGEPTLVDETDAESPECQIVQVVHAD